MTPRISVVLPVRNEAKSLAGLLWQLDAQEYDKSCYEIIVADGMSTDATPVIVRTFAQESAVRTLLVENRGVRSSAGRNAGVSAASGDIILFLDGHCHLPSRFLLRDTAETMERTGASCLCRPQPLIAPSASRMGRLIAAVRSSTLGHGRDSLIYDLSAEGFVDPASSGATYTRKVLQQVGLYNENLDACEDVELNIRVRKAGFRAYTHPSLAVHYEPRSTLASLWRQMMRYGRGRVRLATMHADSLSVAALAPVFLLVLLIAELVTLAIAPLAAVWLAIPLALYAAIVAAATAKLAQSKTPDWWWAPAAYAIIHFGLGAGMLLELLQTGGRGRRSTTVSGE